ncbi:NAD(P)-binding protein [Cadophora sp. DSE1049]|nr:NAD(P)-binding protein [Cadophora sp. DSE1049]
MAKASGDVILLLGGTGKVASRITPMLSSNGNRVLIASRSGASPPLSNASGVKFDWFDSATHASPFEIASVSGIFLIPPPTLNALPIMKPFIDLAISKGVERFVLLSATCIDLGDDILMGKVSEYVLSLKVDYAILRPTWFMENFSEGNHLASIRDQDQIITSTGEGRVPFVSADDIAAVAFRALTDDVSHNLDHLIIGPDLLSYDEVADVLSAELGRKITHVKVTETQLVAGMATFGIPDEYAKALAAMERMIKEGKEERSNDIVLEVTGRRAISFKEFARRNRGLWEKF